ncbi:MAG: hypothetical protein HZA91_04970 [Verrucomicrobia bacterium]|nr:hypothetical protein [Verrucomicrobiota bacterium]
MARKAQGLASLGQTLGKLGQGFGKLAHSLPSFAQDSEKLEQNFRNPKQAAPGQEHDNRFEKRDLRYF